MKCPECKSNDVFGVEIPEIYDGVIFWYCCTCNHEWARKGHEHHYVSWLEHNMHITQKQNKGEK